MDSFIKKFKKNRKLGKRLLSSFLAGLMCMGIFADAGSSIGMGLGAYADNGVQRGNAHPTSNSTDFGDSQHSGTITKSAKWTDIENGLGEITITEKDTGTTKQSLAGTDYVFILDSSHSMDFIRAGISSFCIYPGHYYKFRGRDCKIYDYGSGSVMIAYLDSSRTVITGTELINTENMDEANIFYSLMFLDGSESFVNQYVTFTGYIFNSKDEDSSLWRYEYYDGVNITAEMLNALKTDNVNWASKAPGQAQVAAQRISASSQMQERGCSASNPQLIYSFKETPGPAINADWTNCGHYDSNGAAIAFQFHDIYGNALSKEQSDNYSIHDPGSLRWGYASAQCINKYHASRNTIKELINKIHNADPGAKIAFIPFGYTSYNGYQNASITNYAAVDFTTDVNAIINNGFNKTATQGATTYAEWIDKLDEFMARHNSTEAGRQRKVKAILITDGMPTDMNIDEPVMNSRLGQLANQLKGHYGNSIETALLNEVIPYTIYAMVSGKDRVAPGSGRNYGHKGYTNLYINTLGVGYHPSAQEGNYYGNTGILVKNIAYSGYGTALYIPQVENNTNYFDLNSLSQMIEQTAQTTNVIPENKVLTDVVDDKYEIVSVSAKTGTASFSGQTVTWNVPTNARYDVEELNTLKIKVKLKDEYRYLVSDTFYATNNDAASGCKMNYVVDGNSKTTSVATPWLKYGAVEVKGQKHWTVDGSSLDSVEVLLQRKLGTGAFNTVSSQTAEKEDYLYDFTDRHENSVRYPLIKYDNNGTEYIYRISEDTDNYKLVDYNESDNEGIITYDIYNEPHKADIILKKTDPEHDKKLVYNAEFTVYEYAGTGDFEDPSNYVEYKGKTTDGYFGLMNGNEVVKLEEHEDERGIYRSTNCLYYSPVNQGHFMIKETTTPHGYYGDYLNDVTVSANNAGDVQLYKPHFIVMNSKDHEQTFNIENNGETFDDIPVNTVITITKTGDIPVVSFDEDGNVTSIDYEMTTLSDAWYVLRAASDIYYPFEGESAIAYHKGDFVTLDNEYYQSLAHVPYSDTLEKVVKSQGETVTAKYLDVSEQTVKNLTASVENNMGTGTFEIKWENADKKVNVTLISPEGTVYKSDNYDDYMSVTEGCVAFDLKDITAGEWNIIMEGGKALGMIDVSVTGNNDADVSDNSIIKKVDNDEIDADKLYVDSYVFNAQNPHENKIVFTNGESVSSLYVTDEDGIVRIQGLPLGTYEVVEVKAPAGYTRESGKSSQMAVVVCDNDYTKEVRADLTFYNERQKLNLDGNSTPNKEVIVPDPAISVSKTSDKYVYWNGDTVHYYITVTNTGNVDLKDVTLEDYFEDEEAELIGSIDLLKTGESRDFTFDYVVPEGTPNKTKLENVVVATGTEVLDSTVSENGIEDKTARKVQDVDDCEVVITDNGISVTKTADKKVYLPGDIVYYTIKVSNANDTDLYNVTVDDSYIGTALNDIHFMDADIDGVSNNNGYVTIDKLPAGSTATLKYYVIVPEDALSGEYDNVVIANGEGTDYRIPNITITKTTDKNLYTPGETAIYKIKVTNNGEVDLKNVFVKDTLDGLFVNDDNNIGELKVGESKTLTYEYQIPEDIESCKFAVKAADADINGVENADMTYYKINNIASVTGEGTHTDKDGNNVKTKVEDQDDENIIVVDKDDETAIPDLAKIEVIKELVSRYVTKPENTAEYRITVKNTGNVLLHDVTLEDSLENLGGTWKEEMIPFELESGESKTFGYTYVIPFDTEDGEVIDNTVTAEGTADITYLDEDDKAQNKEITVNDSDDAETVVKLNKDVEDKDDETIIVKNPKINVVKVAYKENYKVGETVVFTITVKNTGDCDLKDVVLNDYLDGKFTEILSETEKEILMSDDTVYVDFLGVGEKLDFEYQYIAKETDNDVQNIVRATGTTVPKVPTEPIIPVEDEDDEIVHVGRNVGVRKLGRSDSEMHAVEGALIGLYAREDIYAMKDINDPDAEPVIKAGTLVDKAYTNEFGYAQFTKDLPLGVYEARELEAAPGYFATDDIVWFDSLDLIHNDQVSDVYRGGDIVDAQTLVYIYLRDDNTFNELADAGLQVTDAEGNIVNAWITKNTNGEGYVIKGLSVDTEYTLTESYARYGYVNAIIRSLYTGGGEIIESDSKHVTFKINSAVTSTDENGKLIENTIPEPLRITITNDFTRGNAKLNKLGEVLESWTLIDKIGQFFKSLFSYILGGLEGIEFKVVAKEDIIHPDGVTGTIFKAGDLVTENVSGFEINAIETSDKLGLITFTDMYLGKYSFIETKGINGYKVSDEPIDFTLQYVNDQTPIVEATEGTVDVINQRQKVLVNIIKKSQETDEVLAGAVFGLYTDEDITDYNGNVIVEEDTLLETGETDGNGKLTFESDIPIGKYYVKEMSAPHGYDINMDLFRFDVTDEENTNDVIEVNLTVYDPLGEIELLLTKTASGKGVAGQPIKYSFTELKNNSPVALTDFTLSDQLPDAVTLTSVNTGVYSYTTRMTVYYQKNGSSEWNTWRNVSTDQAVTLNVSDLKLGDNTKVTAFKFVFDECPAGFTQTTAPYCDVMINNDVRTNTEITNTAVLTGTWKDKHGRAESSVTTKVLYNPQTGDMTNSNVFGIILGAVAIVMTGVITIIIKKKKGLKLIKK